VNLLTEKEDRSLFYGWHPASYPMNRGGYYPAEEAVDDSITDGCNEDSISPHFISGFVINYLRTGHP
jgi:hypothetical protein